MRRRHPLDVLIDGSIKIKAIADAKEIGDPDIVKRSSGGWNRHDVVKRIADVPNLADASVEQRPDTKVIAYADQLLLAVVPDDKAIIPTQVIDKALTPASIG